MSGRAGRSGSLHTRSFEAFAEGLERFKKLTANQRIEIAKELKQTCISYAVGQIEADEIDRINILQATIKAMHIAIVVLAPQADFLLIDALQLKEVLIPQTAIIKGDSISASIASASILAKTYRDDLMREYDDAYPQYGFASHVGYGTKAHLCALRTHGCTPLHRKSFRGVLY